MTNYVNLLDVAKAMWKVINWINIQLITKKAWRIKKTVVRYRSCHEQSQQALDLWKLNKVRRTKCEGDSAVLSQQ